MNNTELLKRISFHLSSVAHCSVGSEWNYTNIISSFSRLYLLTEGEADIYVGEKVIHLQKGNLYLIPSFTHCSYICKSKMTHYYATFNVQLPNNLSIFQLFNFKHEVKASAEHYAYFKQLCQENPNMALPANDPSVYQRMQSSSWNRGLSGAQRSLRSSGILYLLLSYFIDHTKIDLENGGSHAILSVVKYIHEHLNDEFSIGKLAEMSFLSTGHFTRKFKQLTQLNPLEYINRQRIEKAQLLLNTTSLSCVEISESCGFKSSSYFCKLFKKSIGLSPTAYRKHQVQIS